jgi:hypothetical protein
MSLHSLSSLGIAASLLGLFLFGGSSPAEARCTWYGPGSGPRPACMGPAPAAPVLTPAVTPKPTWQIGAVTPSANAVKIPAGYMHRSCVQTRFGIDCR